MRALLLLALTLAACSAEPVRVVSLTTPEDTRDATGPYVIQAELRGALGDDELRVCWSTDGTHFVAAPMRARAGRDDLRFAELPGQPAGTTVSYLVALVAARGACPAVDASTTLSSFRVLASSLGCDVDSDCLQGVEICAAATCRVFAGTCTGGGACPGGYTCDAAADPPTCIVAARTCVTDDGCPPLEECDLTRGECLARP